MRDNNITRGAFTVLELLVVVAVVGLLVGLLLPAIITTREAGRNLTCSNHQRQLGLAFAQSHEATRALPAAWKEASGTTSIYGWTVQLLPYLEQTDLCARSGWDGALPELSESQVSDLSLPLMICPSDITEPAFSLYAEQPDDDDERPHTGVTFDRVMPTGVIATLPTANYVGVFGTIEADDDYPVPFGDGPMIFGRRVRFADLRRGLSKTLIVGERTMAMVPSTWLGVDIRGEDATCRLVGSAMTRPNCQACDECEFASRHVGGVNFLWADGHVGTVSNDIDVLEYQRMAQRR